MKPSPGSGYKELSMPISDQVLASLAVSTQLRKMGAPAVWMGMWAETRNGRRTVCFSPISLDRYAVIEETAEKAGNALQVIVDLRELGLVYSRIEPLIKDMTKEEKEEAGKAVEKVLVGGVREFLSGYIKIEMKE